MFTVKWKKIIVSVLSIQVALIGFAYFGYLTSGEKRQFLWCCDWAEMFGYALFMLVFTLFGIGLIFRKKPDEVVSVVFIVVGLVLFVIAAGALLLQWLCMTCAIS